MRELERLEPTDGLSLSRVTYELLRPVPIGPLVVKASVVRPGRRVQLLEASLHDEARRAVVIARGLRIQTASSSAPTSADAGSPAGPDEGVRGRFRAPHRPMFMPDAIEVRFVAGDFDTPGRATAWFRLHAELVAGESPSPLQRLAAAADFGNGISSTLSWDEYVFINPDLTVYVEREPVGEWICLDSETRIAAGGVGLAESVLYDERGRVGRATQALLVAPRREPGAT
jgi:hypothetical protein